MLRSIQGLIALVGFWLWFKLLAWPPYLQTFHSLLPGVQPQWVDPVVIVLTSVAIFGGLVFAVQAIKDMA